MEKLKEQIEALAEYDQCAHVPPLCFAQILQGILDIAAPIPLDNYVSSGIALPKAIGPFTYQGYPCEMRCVENNRTMYLIFCSYHNQSSGPFGYNYLIFKLKDDKYFFDSVCTHSTAELWVKSPFVLAEVTNNAPGMMSALMYRMLRAVYNWCVAKGMDRVQ